MLRVSTGVTDYLLFHHGLGIRKHGGLLTLLLTSDIALATSPARDDTRGGTVRATGLV